jgi:hypothetical protein
MSRETPIPNNMPSGLRGSSRRGDDVQSLYASTTTVRMVNMLQVLRVNSEKIASGSYVFTFIEIVVSESTSCHFPKSQSCRCQRHQGSSFSFKSRCTSFIRSCQREGYIRRRLKLSRMSSSLLFNSRYFLSLRVTATVLFIVPLLPWLICGQVLSMSLDICVISSPSSSPVCLPGDLVV